MNGRKLKLGFEIGFYAFLMVLMLGGLAFATIQLYLVNPFLLLIEFFIVVTPLGIIAFGVKYKIVRRE